MLQKLIVTILNLLHESVANCHFRVSEYLFTTSSLSAYGMLVCICTCVCHRLYLFVIFYSLCVYHHSPAVCVIVFFTGCSVLSPVLCIYHSPAMCVYHRLYMFITGCMCFSSIVSFICFCSGFRHASQIMRRPSLTFVRI